MPHLSTCSPGLGPSLAQRIGFAKTKSDAVAKMDGTYKERDKQQRQQMNQQARGE